MTTWSEGDIAYLRENYKTKTDAELAEHLGRNKKTVCNKRSQLGLRRMESPNKNDRKPWTAKDVRYLKSHWGESPVGYIASKLGRSVTACKQKANSLGLSSFFCQGGLMSLQAVANMTGVAPRTVISWGKQGLPMRHMRISKKNEKTYDPTQTHYAIHFNDLLSWLQEHPEKWDSRRIPLMGLGVEYDWLTEKRKADNSKTPVYTVWSDVEKSRLRMMLQLNWPYRRIAGELGRSISSVKNQARRLS